MKRIHWQKENFIILDHRDVSRTLCVCKKGTDYYLVCSSFAINPGVPIFHSTDLVNWKQIGHVLDRPSQLKVEDLGIQCRYYAPPTILYNSYNDTFFMITTQFSGGMGNMIVKTKDPMNGAILSN